MNGTASPVNCAPGITNEFEVSGSPEEGWLMVELIPSLEWDGEEWIEYDDGESGIYSFGAEWGELDENELPDEPWPDWYIRLLNGSGDFQSLFSRWTNHE